MIDFYTEHDRDERFEIVAFHDASVGSLAELDAKLKQRGIAEKHWKGRELPFPVLIDKTGATIEQFGVRAFPTVLLVDPEGKLVGMTRGVTELKQRLGLADPNRNR